MDIQGRASLEDRSDVAIAYNVFSSQECNHIIQIAENLGFERAKIIGDDGNADGSADLRTNDISYLTRTDETQFIYDRLFQRITRVNNLHFQSGIFALGDVNVCRYDSTKQQHYGWHVDQMMVKDNGAFQRKLTTTTLLNDRSEFEGGLLQVNLASKNCDWDHGPQHIGDTSVFPSFAVHRVTPVTKGVRYSMVAWFLGPKWI